MQAILDAHDIIATEKVTGQKSTESVIEEVVPSSPWEEINILSSSGNKEIEQPRHPPTPSHLIMPATEIEDDTNAVYAQPIRVVGLRKAIGQPLVSTIRIHT